MPVGWEVLEQWGDDVARVEPLAGGVANDVWSVRVNGHLAVGRLGARSDADLAWETGLLRYLDREGLTVPVPIPTTDGRLFADGVVPSGTARPEIASTSTQHCIVCRFSANSAKHSTATNLHRSIRPTKRTSKESCPRSCEANSTFEPIVGARLGAREPLLRPTRP